MSPGESEAYVLQLVVDTNILYTFFWEKSVARKLLMRQELLLYSPEFALEEINAHLSDIRKKTGISEEDFRKLRSDLAIAVTFMPAEEYSSLLPEALRISPDGNDVDFVALSLKLKLPLWSNDAALKKQVKVKVLSTGDLLKEPEFAGIASGDFA